MVGFWSSPRTTPTLVIKFKAARRINHLLSGPQPSSLMCTTGVVKTASSMIAYKSSRSGCELTGPQSSRQDTTGPRPRLFFFGDFTRRNPQ